MRKTSGHLLLCCTLWLGGCAAGSSSSTVQVDERSVGRQSPTAASTQDPGGGDQSTPLEEQHFNIEQAEYYADLARERGSDEATGFAANNAALSSAEFYIQAENFSSAEAAVDTLPLQLLTPVQRDRYDIVLAYVDYARQQFRVSLNRLNKLLARRQASNESDFSNGTAQVVDALLLSSFCHQALGQVEESLQTLIQRERLLTGSARAETSRYIWQVIAAIPANTRQQILARSENAAVRNRLEQSLLGQINEQGQTPSQFDQWRHSLPTQGAKPVQAVWNETSARNLAVILPLSSKFNRAAQAVIDGINYQHALNQSPFRPTIRFYDAGADPFLVSQQYAAALAEGADFVVGPLGKEYANQMAPYALQAGQVPTVLLGGDGYLSGNVSRLTMSPEWDGETVARQAVADGHTNAALLVPSTSVGKRTSDAFIDYWLSVGGRVSSVINYSPKQYDHSTELKQLFNIGQSEYRHTKLSNTLGFKPKFAAYRRADIDFIFMIADNKAGRLVRPQINFFSGSKLPVYAGTAIFNGIQDRTNNVDLDQTHFPVMPWMIRSADAAPYAGQLNMLFAMGADAYQVAGHYRRLRNDNKRLDGNMGALTMTGNGEIRYQPLWAEFINGIATPASGIEELDIESRTMLDNTHPDGENGSRKNGNSKGVRSYNESNWDPRQPRRKPGT